MPSQNLGSQEIKVTDRKKIVKFAHMMLNATDNDNPFTANAYTDEAMVR